MRMPANIDYATVHNVHFPADFGRVEARVRLHMAQETPPTPEIEILTNVAAIQDEPKSTLNTRLVVSAARLFRQFEVSHSPFAHPNHGEPAA